MKVYIAGVATECRTVENLGYLRSIGHYARIVVPLKPAGPGFTAVKDDGIWRRWSPAYRIRDWTRHRPCDAGCGKSVIEPWND